MEGETLDLGFESPAVWGQREVERTLWHVLGADRRLCIDCSWKIITSTLVVFSPLFSVCVSPASSPTRSFKTDIWILPEMCPPRLPKGVWDDSPGLEDTSVHTVSQWLRVHLSFPLSPLLPRPLHPGSLCFPTRFLNIPIPFVFLISVLCMPLSCPSLGPRSQYLFLSFPVPSLSYASFPVLSFLFFPIPGFSPWSLVTFISFIYSLRDSWTRCPCRAHNGSHTPADPGT